MPQRRKPTDLSVTTTPRVSKLTGRPLNTGIGSTTFNMEFTVPKPESVLLEAERLIHGQKRDNYGDPKESFETIWKGWEPILASDLPGPVKVALCMDWLKTSRFLTNHGRDDLVDKGGYCGLAAWIMDIDQ